MFARGFATTLALACLLAPVAAAQSGEDGRVQARELRYTAPDRALELLAGDIDASADDSVAFEALQLRAEILRDMGRLDEALADVQRLEQALDAASAPVQLARALHVRGSVEAERGNPAVALEHFHEARRLLVDTDEISDLARVTMAIGVAHTFANEYERTRGYYIEALALARQAGDAGLETRLLGNLAVVVSELDGVEAGLVLHREARALAERRADPNMVAYQSANICNRLVQINRLDEAERECGQAVELLEPLGHARVLAGTRQTLGDLLRGRGRAQEALAHYRDALEDIEQGVPTVAADTLERLASLHQEQGDFELALGYFQRMVALREQIRDVERQRLIEELEVRYAVEQREREIDLLRSDRETQTLQIRQRNWLVGALVVAFALLAGVAILAWRGFRSSALLQRQLAAEDSLTGVFNRRAFLSLAQHELRRARRSAAPLSVAIADVDLFKPVNDSHGHAVGDEVLKELVRRMQVTLRDADVICRWGGEEFVLMFPDASQSDAVQAAERIRQALHAQPVETSAGPLAITMTFGVAPVEESVQAAIEAADIALYQGKRDGRDRVVAATGS